jgi:hypothetical protein
VLKFQPLRGRFALRKAWIGLLSLSQTYRLAVERKSGDADLYESSCLAAVDLLRSRAAIEAEIQTLWQQIIVLRQTTAKNQTFGAIDRLVFVGLYHLFPRVLDALAIVTPGTGIKWHRSGFRLYWRWKSRPRGGRPTVPLEVRRLIREMSITNPLW